MTPREQADYDYLRLKYERPETAPTPVEDGLLGRFSKSIGNSPSYALEGLMGVGTGISNLFEPAGDKTPHAQIPDIFPMAPAKNLAEMAVDVPGQLLGVLPQFVVPGGLAAKGIGALGAAATTANIVGQTVGGIVGGLSESPQSAAVQGGIGTIQGFAEKLPRSQRAVYAAGVGLVGAAEAYLNDGPSTTGTRGGDALTFGAMNALSTFMGGQVNDALSRAKKINAIEIQQDGGTIAPARGPGINLTSQLQVPAHVAYSDLGAHDVFARQDPGTRYVGDFPAPGEVSPTVAPLQLAPERAAIDPGIPFYEPASNGIHLVGQKGVETPGWKDGPIPLSDRAIPFDPNAPRTRPFEDPLIPGPFTAEGAYGRGTDLYDAFAGTSQVPERNGIPPVEPPIATLQTPHFQEKLKPKVQELLKDSGFGNPREMPAQGQEANAHALGAKIKTKAELNQLKNAKKAIEAEMDAAMDAGNMDLASEIAFKSQFLGEAIEYAEGSPGKLNTYLSRDPNYKPSVPGKEYLSSTGAPPVPKKGTAFSIKSGGMPQAGTVTKVSKGVVHYQVEDFLSGEITHHTATPEEFATLQKGDTAPPPPHPTEPVKPAALSAPESKPSNSFQSRDVYFIENGRRTEGTVVGRDGDTLTVRVNDPIRGERTAFVRESEAQPRGPAQGEITKGGVPFQDVPGAKQIKTRSAGDFDDLDDIINNRDAARRPLTHDENGQPLYAHDIPDIDTGSSDELMAYLQRYKSQTIAQAAQELDGLGGLVMKDMLQRVLKASGQENFPVTVVASEDSMRAASMNLLSGKIELDWGTMRRILRDYSNLAPEAQATAQLQLTKMLGHELSHAAVRLGKAAGLEINGRSLRDAIDDEVFKLPLTTRQFIAGEIKDAVGEKGVVSNYLAGDIERVWNHYKISDPRLTKDRARSMASEEFMVELMSIELHKRMEVKGLPGIMRAAIDKLKNVVQGVMRFFGKQQSELAALQNLQKIANATLDSFAQADDAQLSKAFPSSRYWENRAQKQMDLGGRAPTNFVEPTDPLDWISLDYATGHPPAPATSESFIKNEMLRVGIRAVAGGFVGGLVAPTVSRDQLSTAEGVLLGGILGTFGPAVARRILNTDLVVEASKALVAGKGNPVKSLEALMAGRSLRQLGGEALFNERSGVARMVRALEIGIGINFPKQLRGILENSRGLVAEQVGAVWDALKKAKDYEPTPALKIATLQFLKGDMPGTAYVKLLGTAEEKAYGTLITTARSATDNLQTMVASGLKESVFKKQVQESIGSYMGKFYSAYTKAEFNEGAYAAAKADLQKAFPDYSSEVSDAIMHQYMREAKAERTMFGRVSNTGQQMDPTLWSRRLATESEIEAQQAIVSALTPADPTYKAAKEKLDWQQSHKISDGWAEWMGEVHDPKERILRTFQRLYASSISSKTFDTLSTHVDDFGLKYAYGAEELSKLTENGKARLGHLAPDSPEFATLQKQLDELKYYVPLPTGAQYGKLSGKMVNRFVRDGIATDTSPFKWMEQPVFRAISEFNNFIKVGRTAFNPITVIRNYLQMPLFGLIAKTNMTDLTEAWRHIRDRTDLNGLMLREGITTADMSVAELTDGPGRLFSGFFDSDAATRMAAKGINTALEIYRAPDAVLRAGTFISALKRFADGDLRVGLADRDIIQRAVDYTNRYTMNYHTVPQVIKVARQLPFVSLFLSYTSEITRILGNLVQDAINPHADSAGRMHALMTLGGMAAIPVMMVAAGESSLSKADRREWDKVKAMSPEYARQRFRIPLYRDAKGSFHYADLTNLLPADSYSMMVKAIAQGDWSAAAATNPVLNLTNTPLLTIATEQISGKDAQTGQPIRGLDRGRSLLREILPPITPVIGYEAERIVNAFTPNAGGGLGLTNARTGRSVMPSDIVANYLTGMKFANVDPTVIQRGFVAEAKQRVAEQQYLLRQVTATNATPAVKAAAVERHNSAIKEIMFAMHEKLHLGD